MLVSFRCCFVALIFAFLSLKQRLNYNALKMAIEICLLSIHRFVLSLLASYERHELSDKN